VCGKIFFPQRKFDEQTLDSFYTGLSPDVLVFLIFIELLGAKSTGKSTGKSTDKSTDKPTKSSEALG
jgi:hypothetical protein